MHPTARLILFPTICAAGYAPTAFSAVFNYGYYAPTYGWFGGATAAVFDILTPFALAVVAAPTAAQLIARGVKPSEIDAPPLSMRALAAMALALFILMSLVAAFGATLKPRAGASAEAQQAAARVAQISAELDALAAETNATAQARADAAEAAHSAAKQKRAATETGARARHRRRRGAGARQG